MHTYVLPHGLEPWTSRLLAERSNQLSYESSRAAISPAVWQTHITISSKRLEIVCLPCNKPTAADGMDAYVSNVTWPRQLQ